MRGLETCSCLILYEERNFQWNQLWITETNEFSCNAVTHSNEWACTGLILMQVGYLPHMHLCIRKRQRLTFFQILCSSTCVSWCCANRCVVVVSASQGGEPAAALRDRRPPRATGLARQVAGLHGGEGHAHHPVPNHLQEPARPLPPLYFHKGQGRLSRGKALIFFYLSNSFLLRVPFFGYFFFRVKYLQPIMYLDHAYIHI